MELFKDIHEKEVSVGDKVVLLYKAYGYRRLDNAYILDAEYLGRNRGCYQFRCFDKTGWSATVNIKKPQCVLFRKSHRKKA